METAREDDEIAERMDAGRRALMDRASARSVLTSRPWKTACSTSTVLRREMGDAAFGG